MGDKVTLTRPDGSTFEADRDDAEQFRALGYSPETAQDTHNRNIEAAKEEYFTAPGQRTIAGLEGFINGLTVGGYTTFLGGDEDEQERARYNPGTRLGGELVGAVLPSLIPGGAEAEAARLATPVGLLERGAEAVAGATTATKTGHAVVKGVVEGAAFGGAAEATNAKLSGDPVTAEAVISGMGWGALWGGGLGYVAGKLGVAGEKAAAEAPAAHVIPNEAWGQFRSTVNDVRTTALKTIDDATAEIDAHGIPRSSGFEDDMVSTVNARDIEARGFTQPEGVGVDKVKMDKARRAIAEGQKEPINIAVDSSGKLDVVDGRHRLAAALEADAPVKVRWSRGVNVDDTLAARVLGYADRLEEAQGALFNRIDIKRLGAKRGVNGFKKELRDLQKAITRAVNDRNYAAFEGLAARHKTVMGALGDLTRQAVPELEPFVLKSATEGSKALDSLKSLRAVADSFDGLPFTQEGFTRMTPKKLEKIAAAAEQFIKTAPDELTGQKDAMAKAIDDLVGLSGVDAGSLTPAQKLRQLHETLRNTGTKKAAQEAEKLRTHGFGDRTVKYVGGSAIRNAVRQRGGGMVQRGLAYEAGYHLTSGLLALAGGVKGTLLNSVSKFRLGATGTKVAKLVAPRVDPLKVRLDGSLEEMDKPRKQLMQERMKEIREAAPTINDTLFRAVQPLISQGHQALAVQMHKAAVAQFSALATRMPRDPGTAISRMKSLWAPDGIMTEKFARAYEVFQNPVGVATRWLQNPKSITPEGARMMQEHIPELWQMVRVEMLDRLSEPGMMDKMSYSEQVGLGQMLGIRFHSSQDPQFIQAQQAMFQKRNEPLPARPSAANNSNNPSGTSRDMTPAQRITEH